MKYASLISLGCAKNLVDSEEMVMQLLNLGYSMTEEAAEADLIVVNTCGFQSEPAEFSSVLFDSLQPCVQTCPALPRLRRQ